FKAAQRTRYGASVSYAKEPGPLALKAHILTLRGLSRMGAVRSNGQPLPPAVRVSRITSTRKD
ncbi:MAG: hypothetical protein FWC64_11835, partial [Treponema sp.]|nr:hypothetical protein [Treponema sp.]